jgi:hypothetical protein
MKMQLIDTAYNIPDFDSQATELTYALNKTMSDTDMVHTGFKIALDVITHHPELIRPTLHATMNAVKDKCRLNHNRITPVSFSVNHLIQIKMKQKLHEQSEALIKQQQEQIKVDKMLSKELALDIKEMLTGTKRKKYKRIAN